MPNLGVNTGHIETPNRRALISTIYVVAFGELMQYKNKFKGKGYFSNIKVYHCPHKLSTL